MLEQELKLYEQMKAALPVGQFVLIRGDELIGIYETESQALSEGARRFGRESFLLRRVGNEEPVFTNPALSLGILRASRQFLERIGRHTPCARDGRPLSPVGRPPSASVGS